MVQSKISIIMPAYNEAQFIETNVLETVSTLDQFGYDFEVIVVDDGSPDSTHLHAVRAHTRHPERVRVVRYDQNEGKGNALLCGVSYATGDIVVFLDADMELHPVQLPTLFELMTANDADAVIGSKWHPLSNVRYPVVRRLYSMVYFALVRALFGLPLRDTQTGIKVFRSALLHRVAPRLLCKRFAFDIELLANAHRLGYKVIDAPVTLTFQRGLGRINRRHAYKMLVDTLAIFYRMTILKYYDRVDAASHASEPLYVQIAAREVHAAIHSTLAAADRERRSCSCSERDLVSL